MSSNELKRYRPPQKTKSLFTCAKRLVAPLALLPSLALLASCGSGSSSSDLQQTLPTPPGSALTITASTTFYPTFDPNITDYVVTPPSGTPLQLTVNAPSTTRVAVDNAPFRTQAFSTQINLKSGQSFSFVVSSGGTSKTYYVRCLPADFPTWTTETPGTSQAEYYAFAPDFSLTNQNVGRYYIIADVHGVPIWWYYAASATYASKFLPNGNIAWTLSTGVEEHKLNGALVRSFANDHTIGGLFDSHEVQQLANGDYVTIADVIVGPIDLTAYQGTANDFIQDNVIEEIAPNGSLVWHWSALEHIPIAEMDPIWNNIAIRTLVPADPYHMNSIHPDATGFVISCRQQNAIFHIDKATGNITWKLGGTQRTGSLKFVGDTYGNFGGQHDARLLPDGTLTLHDNGTLQNRGPRAVRYKLDTSAGTATLLEQVTDPDVTNSYATGGARKLPQGNWVMEWGLNPVLTEMTPSGQRVFRMTINSLFSYRSEPLAPGTLSRTALRAGMDAQFPR